MKLATGVLPIVTAVAPVKSVTRDGEVCATACRPVDGGDCANRWHRRVDGQLVCGAERARAVGR